LTPNVDAALDVAGRGALPDSIALVGGTDRVLTIADPAAQSLGVRFSAGTPDTRSTEDLAQWLTLVARGDLKTTVAGSYPLERAADAQRTSANAHAPGKLVLTVG
jgi:NADPH:quinone reductase-like Zn-dependent oxidoreductase